MSMPIKLILLTLISFGLASCASGPKPVKLKPDEAEILFARGEYQKADALFLDLARQARPQRRTALLLRAAAA